MTSTSRKIVFAALVFTLFASAASAQHYYGEAESAYTVQTGDSEYSIPQYETQEEMLVKLVIPFIIVAIILQRGTEKALMFTLADDDSLADVLTGEGGEKKRIRRQSVIIATLITAMAVPTPYWGYIQDIFHALAFVPAALMGIFGVIVVLAALLLLYFFLTG